MIKNDNDVRKFVVDHFNKVNYDGVVTTAFPMKTRSLTFGELIRISGADLLAIRLQKQIECCEKHEDKCKLMNLYCALFNDRDLWNLNDPDKEKTYVDVNNYKFIAPDAANLLGEAYGKALTIIMAYLDGFGLNNISGGNDIVSKRLEEAGITGLTDGDEIHIGDVRFDAEKIRVQFNVSYTKRFVIEPNEDEEASGDRVTFICNPITLSISIPLIDSVLDYEYGIHGPKKGECIYNIYIEDSISVFTSASKDIDIDKLKERVNVDALKELVVAEINSSYDVFNQKLYALSLHTFSDNLCENCSSCIKLGHSDCNPYMFDSSDKTQDDINELVEDKFKIRCDKIKTSEFNKTAIKPATWINDVTTKRWFNLFSKDHAGIFNILSTPKYPFLKDAIIYTQVNIAEETEYIQELINQAMSMQEEELKKEEETKEETVEEKKNVVDSVRFDPDTPDEYE